MTKEQLAISIFREMQKGRGKTESIDSFQCINNYFLDLEMQDLVGIAGQYGICVEADWH